MKHAEFVARKLGLHEVAAGGGLAAVGARCGRKHVDAAAAAVRVLRRGKRETASADVSTAGVAPAA
eukprot:364480-Chlamydomonas_euryale.AAC.25